MPARTRFFQAGFGYPYPRVRVREPPRRPLDRHVGARPSERGSELAARGDLELAVDAREVDLDRLHRDEERLGDLLVAVLLRGQLGDTALAGGQRLDPAHDELARPRTRRGELLVAAGHERPRAGAVGQL